MNGYIFMLVALGLLSAVGSALAHAELRAPTRAALGILVLAAVAAPIGSLADDMMSPPVADAELPAAAYESTLADAFAGGVAAAAAERLGLAEELVGAECDGFVPKECRAGIIRLRIAAELPSNVAEQLREYICESFTNGGRCEIELVGREA